MPNYALAFLTHLSMLTLLTYKMCSKLLHTRTSNWSMLALKHITLSAPKDQYPGRHLNSKKRVTFKVPYCIHKAYLINYGNSLWQAKSTLLKLYTTLNTQNYSKHISKHTIIILVCIRRHVMVYLEYNLGFVYHIDTQNYSKHISKYTPTLLICVR